jgi:hypothetical protein
MRVAFALLITFTTMSASAHIVFPRTIRLDFGVNTATFTVADQNNCAAEITIAVADPSIVSVDPMRVVAVQQVFTVRALKGGRTSIVVRWFAAGSCNDIGEEIVDVEVVSGPDLVVTHAPIGGRMRKGTSDAFSFTVRNQGNVSSNGRVLVTNPVDPDKWVSFSGLDECALAPAGIRCERNLMLAPGAEAEFRDAIVFTAIAAGILTNQVEVGGGGDVVLLNNFSNVVHTDVVESREEPGRMFGDDTIPVNGRRR